MIQTENLHGVVTRESYPDLLLDQTTEESHHQNGDEVAEAELQKGTSPDLPVLLRDVTNPLRGEGGEVQKNKTAP